MVRFFDYIRTKVGNFYLLYAIEMKRGSNLFYVHAFLHVVSSAVSTSIVSYALTSLYSSYCKMEKLLKIKQKPCFLNKQL